jgi:hypothetical protein
MANGTTPTTNGKTYWDPTTIASQLQSAAGGIRVAQQIFYCDTSMQGSTSIPADVFDPDTMSIKEGITKPFIEISSEFRLTNGQASDATGQTGTKLALAAARRLALVEDLLFFRGNDFELEEMPRTVKIESGRESAGKGIFGLAPHEIQVKPNNGRSTADSGLEIYGAVIEGISELSSPRNLQSGKYALILDSHSYSVTGGSAINGTPTMTVLSLLTAMLTPQIYQTGALPPYSGILASLGGDVGAQGGPTTIYIGSDIAAEQTGRGNDGHFLYRAYERVQIVAQESRAFVKLKFDAYRQRAEEARAKK